MNEKTEKGNILEILSVVLLVLGFLGSPFSGMCLGAFFYDNSLLFNTTDVTLIIIEILIILALICPVASLIICLIESYREYGCKWTKRNIILSVLEMGIIVFFFFQGFYGMESIYKFIANFGHMSFG